LYVAEKQARETAEAQTRQLQTEHDAEAAVKHSDELESTKATVGEIKRVTDALRREFT